MSSKYKIDEKAADFKMTMTIGDQWQAELDEKAKDFKLRMDQFLEIVKKQKRTPNLFVVDKIYSELKNGGKTLKELIQILQISAVSIDQELRWAGLFSMDTYNKWHILCSLCKKYFINNTCSGCKLQICNQCESFCYDMFSQKHNCSCCSCCPDCKINFLVSCSDCTNTVCLTGVIKCICDKNLCENCSYDGVCNNCHPEK